MKILFILLAFGALTLGVILAKDYLSNKNFKKEDLSWRNGKLSSNPRFSKDEDGIIVSVKLRLENESKPLVIPGKLLRTLDFGLDRLSEGDEISFAVVEKESYKPVKSLYSLEDKNGSILNLDQATHFYEKNNYVFLLLATFAFGVGATLIFYSNKV
ncbi:MAG: hypothetical protein MRZ79_14705 [Bacteroidia bacterium]|nr:hypothetical protein [Bacteroidia bacterium]